MAQRPKPKAKARPRSKPHFDDKAQSERFIEAARKLEIEGSKADFERAVQKIIAVKTSR
jgi:hypothetical protein